MLYRVGNILEAMSLPLALPKEVKRQIVSCTSYLDKHYGTDRDYIQTGGYSLIPETDEDVLEVKEIVDYEDHPCEWVNRIGEDYVSALFVMNDDFTILLFMPVDIAPDSILTELDELEDMI